MSSELDIILSPMKRRLVQYLHYQRIKKSLFFKKTGISPSNFKSKSAKSEMGGEMIAKILTEYIEINPTWLILGKGKVLRSKEELEELAKDQQDLDMLTVAPRKRITKKELEILVRQFTDSLINGYTIDP